MNKFYLAFDLKPLEEKIQADFLIEYNSRYNQCWRKLSKFKSNEDNIQWMQSTFTYDPSKALSNNNSEPTTSDATTQTSKTLRVRLKNHNNKSTRPITSTTQEDATENTNPSVCLRELRVRLGRPHLNFKTKGGRTTEFRKVKILKDSVPQTILVKSLTKKTISNIKKTSQKSIYDAVAFYMDTRMSKARYHILRNYSKDSNLYPPYSEIVNEMKACYPPNLVITETKSEVPIKDLWEHTLKRLMIVLNLDQLKLFHSSEDIVFLMKIGFDSTSGLSNYQMKINQPNGALPPDNFGDSSAFVASLCPLVLRGSKGKSIFILKKIVVYESSNY